MGIYLVIEIIIATIYSQDDFKLDQSIITSLYFILQIRIAYYASNESLIYGNVEFHT